MTAAPEVQTSTKAVTRFTAENAHEARLPTPETINYMASVVNLLSGSALISKDMLLAKPQRQELAQAGWTAQQIDDKEAAGVKANGMAKMLVGWELGIDPIQAMQDVSIVKGKIFLHYSQLIRLIEEKGYAIHEVERSSARAAIRLEHPKKPTRTFEFTIEDAKLAGLIVRGYNNEPSMYEKRPRVMLYSRVISEAFRATGGRGSVYSLEEKDEFTAEAPDPKAPEVDPYYVADPSRGQSNALKAITQAVTQAAGELMSGTGVYDPSLAKEVPAEATAGSADTGNGEAQGEKPEAKATPQAGTEYERALQKIGAAFPNKAEGQKIMDDFLRGFLGVTRIPKNHPQIVNAIPFLAKLCDNPAELQANAKTMGLNCYNGWCFVAKLIEETPNVPEYRSILRRVAIEKFAKNPKDLVDFLNETLVSVPNLSVADTVAFLKVFLRTGEAYRLADAVSTDEGIWDTIAGIVAGWGLDLETCTDHDIHDKMASMIFSA